MAPIGADFFGGGGGGVGVGVAVVVDDDELVEVVVASLVNNHRVN